MPILHEQLRCARATNLHWAAGLILAILVLALIGCSPAPVRQIQKVDGVTIGLEHPAQARINQEVESIITVTDASNRTINDALVVFDLEMPAMPMGQNRPIADSIGGGRYRVRTAYSMIGTWHATVSVTIAGREYRALFEQEVGS